MRKNFAILKSPAHSGGKLQTGFTIIELLVVIVVIGILLALVFATRAGVSEKERNTERQRDITELRDVVETYYAQNDKYPTLSELNDDKWRQANLKILEDREVVHDPLDDSGKYQFASKPTPDIYSYHVTATDGSTCDNQAKACTQYTLIAQLEGGGRFAKNNLN